MESGQESQNPANLEDQLRRMILDNVRIGPNDTANAGAGSRPTQQYYQDHSNGRARGRGFHNGPHGGRGFNRGNHSQPSFGDVHHTSNHQQASQARLNEGANAGFRGRGRGGRGSFFGGPQQPRVYQGAQQPARPPPQHDRLYHPSHNHNNGVTDQRNGQRSFFDNMIHHLDAIAQAEIAQIEMSAEELQSKDDFRSKLNTIFTVAQAHVASGSESQLALQTFGSLKSGFATAGSDMDLVIVDIHESAAEPEVSLAEDGIARRFEKELLERGFGARLLTRARVPIIKVCEKPNPELLEALRKSRAEWDALSEEEKLEYGKDKKANHVTAEEAQAVASALAAKKEKDSAQAQDESRAESGSIAKREEVLGAGTDRVTPTSATEDETGASAQFAAGSKQKPPGGNSGKDRKGARPWLREKKKSPLDFPKDGVGIQSDINFFNPLGLYNTHMLYCYSLCDIRVRQMVLFIKSWARRRKINTPYMGTLSSYGYVLMALHYLVNIANPPVLPNLQLEGARLGVQARTINGWDVRFWGNEDEIKGMVTSTGGSRNRESVGSLLKGFFNYYASNNNSIGFVWMRDVLSLRNPRGILSKQEKGWTGAKTETTETKEVRHRYLFAIEDPFELTHNVARTVTHQGIVAIRDEFRRAWRILVAKAGNRGNDEGLLDELKEHEETVQDEQAQAVEKETQVGATTVEGETAAEALPQPQS